MNNPALQAQIEAAHAYESLFVPALFGQWAARLADALELRPDSRVLDVACGTGVLARELARRLGPDAQVVGLDAGPGMIAVARALAPRLEWQQGVAEALPFADGAFDRVASQFGLMFFDDRRQALREMARVLAPGGRLAVAVWDALPAMPAYEAEVALLERIAGQRAADALRAPFVLGRREELAALLADLGLEAPRIATLPGRARFPSVQAMVEADLRGWLPVMGVTLDEACIRRILDEAGATLAPFVSSAGGAEFPLSAHLLTAAKPA